MIALHFGTIPMGSNTLTGPSGRSISRTNTFAQYDVTRGKLELHEIGEELDTQSFDFFFSEEFCDPQSELNKLELAFAMKTPFPLLFATGGFIGKRYVVESLEITVQKTNRAGRIVRVEASISLLEAPVASLLGLFSSITRALAPALSRSATKNPNVRQ
ncbi:phage tail protein [uncultured Pelagimonas sp.]|uniref:phage tail protein n=1 Tax=uncultured Pelagimonas sp. TaxID=1618102 RepID=UPI0026245583|nr:phage tail protein [uncultured Pelagimonas sp.]